MDKLFSPKSTVSLIAGAITTLLVHTYNFIMKFYFNHDDHMMSIDVAQSLQTLVTWLLVMFSPHAVSDLSNGSK